MILEMLYSLRHCEPGKYNGLSEQGEEIAAWLGSLLAKEVKGKVAVITSTHDRAIGTGWFIEQALGASCVLNRAVAEVFCDTYSHPVISSLIRELGETVQVVIIVTHDVSVQTIVTMATELLGIICPALPAATTFEPGVQLGSGYRIDVVAKKVDRFPSA